MTTSIETWWDIMEDKNLELCIKFCNSLTLRESKACIRTFGHNTFTESVSEARDYIKEILHLNASKDYSINNIQLVSQLKEFIKNHILDDKDVCWIKDLDDEQVFFYYFILRDYESVHNLIFKPPMTPVNNKGFSSLFSHSDENRVLTKKRDYAERIILFLDSTYGAKELKFCLLSAISNEYRTYKSKNLLEKWLNRKNKDQIFWTTNYLSSKLGFQHALSLTSEQTCYYIKYRFYFWDMSYSEKELFVIKLKKAWSQVKFRGQDNRKKPFNIVMDKSIKDKLDFLSNSQNRPRNEIVEELINTAYNELNK